MEMKRESFLSDKSHKLIEFCLREIELMMMMMSKIGEGDGEDDRIYSKT